MFLTLVEIQRAIYTALAEQIKLLSAEGDWLAFLAFLPMGVLFGAVHALTPGHSKAVLATYLGGSEAKIGRGLLVSLTLSFTHVTIAVLIAVLSLPLVSIALGSVGRAPIAGRHKPRAARPDRPLDAVARAAPRASSSQA